MTSAKATFDTTKKTLFTRKLDLNLKKKLVKYYTWIITLCGAGNWALEKVDQKYLKSSEMWPWRRMRRSVGPIV
jgi:hypothetical protein